jgi:GDP-L-fucose synthase
MPTNLYGPNDNYDLENSHVLPALIRKFHLAKLAKFKDIEGIKRDAFYYGTIPEDVKKHLNIKLEKSSSEIRKQCNKNLKEPAVMLWGTGKPRREFLHVDDLAKACVFFMKISDKIYPSLINIGCGEDLTVSELANLVADVVGYKGKIIWDHKKPAGTPRKLLDISRLSSMGWKPEISLKKGIEQTYKSYLEKQQIK